MPEKKPPTISQANDKKDESLPPHSNEKQAQKTAVENANQEQTSAENANDTEEKSLNKNETNEKVDEKGSPAEENAPKKKHKHKKKHKVTEESKPHNKKFSCKCRKRKCCPHFPRCCPLPLMNCLQILAALDLVLLPV